MLFLEEEVLIDALHSVHLTHLAVRDKEYLAKTAFINDFADLKVFKRDHLSLQAWLSNEALTRPLVLICFLLVQFFGRVEL